MKPIQFSALIEKVSANKDRTLGIKLDTQELNADETSKIFSLFEKQIWLAMAEVPVRNEEFDAPESVEFKKDKTPSQRLRDRLYVYFTQMGGKKEDFKVWYEKEFEKIGNSYLDKLN